MLGTDFEVFVVNRKNLEAVPATVFGLNGKVGVHLPLLYEGEPAGSVHRDNLMLETCVIPGKTGAEFTNNVRTTMLAAAAFVEQHNHELIISTVPEAEFSIQQLSTPEAKDIGCDVDFLSGGESIPRQPIAANTLKFHRYAGGHCHISYDTSLAPPWVGAMLCDLFIGLPHKDRLNVARSEFYGGATLHRPTRYPNGSMGVEYRVLDSFWVHNQEQSVINGMELVQSLLVPQHMDALRLLIELHRSNLVAGAPIATVDEFDKGRAEGIIWRAEEILKKFTPLMF